MRVPDFGFVARASRGNKGGPVAASLYECVRSGKERLQEREGRCLGQLNMRILHETGSQSCLSCNLCINTILLSMMFELYLHISLGTAMGDIRILLPGILWSSLRFKAGGVSLRRHFPSGRCYLIINHVCYGALGYISWSNLPVN